MSNSAMPESPQAPTPVTSKTLEDTVKEARADGVLTRAELEGVMKQYQDQKDAILKSANGQQISELHTVNALLAESFDDMFEEYEIKGSEDLQRIENILKVVNPLRLANDKMGVIINAEVTEFYAKSDNTNTPKNIKLDSLGQLRFQAFYEGLFVREGRASVKTSVENLSKDDLNKLSKMLTGPNNMLRGSNPDYAGYLKVLVEKYPVLKSLSDIQSSSVGDLHLGQLETINGKVQISDIDDALRGGSPLIDIVRIIASIGVSAAKPEEATTNINAFMSALTTTLEGRVPSTLASAPTPFQKLDSPETQQQLLNGGFVNANEQGMLQGENIKRISSEEKTALSQIIGKTVIDGRHDKSDGIGSSGKDKILVTVQDGIIIRIYEFKEQDKTHVYKTWFNSHSNTERSEVAKQLGVDIKAVDIGDKPYTQKEIVPGYKSFDPAKSDPKGRKWASEQIAIQLAGLYKQDGHSADILSAIQAPGLTDALKGMGGEYQTRIVDALKSGKEAYPEVVAENEKNDAKKLSRKK